jgi:protein-ribulosamine 3-kinase
MVTSVPSAIQQSITESCHLLLQHFSFCGGGCINQGGKLTTSKGIFFLKWNSDSKYPGMFEAEAKGLQLLLKPNVIHIPKVVLHDVADSWQFILMEFIDEKPSSHSYWDDLGRLLAGLHSNTAPTFGLDHHNYIGSLQQSNTPSADWVEFFCEHRLRTQLKLAFDQDKINRQLLHQFDVLFRKLPSVLPVEKPALLHGDLWRGNLISDELGNPCLIDPAVYYGNREAEIAFTRLFGGFSDYFYNAYEDAFPIQSGFAERINIYNLYPLLVHVNLFGGGYLSQVVSILNRLV